MTLLLVEIRVHTDRGASTSGGLMQKISLQRPCQWTQELLGRDLEVLVPRTCSRREARGGSGRVNISLPSLHFSDLIPYFVGKNTAIGRPEWSPLKSRAQGRNPMSGYEVYRLYMHHLSQNFHCWNPMKSLLLPSSLTGEETETQRVQCLAHSW